MLDHTCTLYTRSCRFLSNFHWIKIPYIGVFAFQHSVENLHTSFFIFVALLRSWPPFLPAPSFLFGRLRLLLQIFKNNLSYLLIYIGNCLCKVIISCLVYKNMLKYSSKKRLIWEQSFCLSMSSVINGFHLL